MEWWAAYSCRFARLKTSSSMRSRCSASGCVGAGFELLHRGKSVGEQPLQILGAQRLAALAVREGLFGAN